MDPKGIKHRTNFIMNKKLRTSFYSPAVRPEGVIPRPRWGSRDENPCGAADYGWQYSAEAELPYHLFKQGFT
jgi:hypothetical protein